MLAIISPHFSCEQLRHEEPKCQGSVSQFFMSAGSIPDQGWDHAPGQADHQWRKGDVSENELVKETHPKLEPGKKILALEAFQGNKPFPPEGGFHLNQAQWHNDPFTSLNGDIRVDILFWSYLWLSEVR